ncbi:hypothetical protein B0H16DRAFT_730025 [Mycena metata]|uniref:F-box domain-containing protein n=1 Tax=Mycena metata TaxID=1033252 RepID=A0AAD7NCZ4_9AGAR|nr:hypothetical protein B0H16DRAFT_730025 [Mycena metata]
MQRSLITRLPNAQVYPLQSGRLSTDLTLARHQPSQIFEVPIEIWSIVATLAGRRSIARLSAVSHAFYSVFSVILYCEMIIKPPLTWQQTPLLMRTLAESHSPLKFDPHPVQQIRTLRLPGVGYRAIDLGQCLSALKGLLKVSLSERGLSNPPMRGAALRALTWDSELGADEMAEVLFTPGYFPNLTELSVRCAERRFNVSRSRSVS